MKSTALCFALLFAGASSAHAQRQRLSMDPGWRFTLGDPQGAEATKFDDHQWRKVDLPHDWSIEGTPDQSAPAGGRGGFFPTGIGWYRKAIDAGLREPHRHRALIQLASSLRVVGRPEDALRILDDLATYRPSSVAVEAFRALARHDGGDHGGALAGLLTFVVDHATDPEDQAYARALRAYAAQLTPTPPPCGSS